MKKRKQSKTVKDLLSPKFTISEKDYNILITKLKEGSVWSPSPGDIIIGVIKEYKQHTGKFGRKLTKTRQAFIVTKEGIKLVWIKDVLEKRFTELKIVPGSVVAIEYLGKPEGKKYHNYSVAVL